MSMSTKERYGEQVASDWRVKCPHCGFEFGPVISEEMNPDTTTYCNECQQEFYFGRLVTYYSYKVRPIAP